MRLIDGDALASKLFDHHFSVPVLENEQKVLSEALHMIHEAPTIIKCGITSEGLPLMDLTPRPRGKWVHFGQFSIFYKCSRCGNMPLKWGTADDDYLSDFCPYCGALMEGAKEMRTQP